jgi:hypothetical protein
VKRFLFAIRAALAAFLTSWRGPVSASALGPYRKAAKREPCEWCAKLAKDRRSWIAGYMPLAAPCPAHTPSPPRGGAAREANAWTEAQRGTTPADMRAAEARRQSVVVEKPLERLAHHQNELARLRAEADIIRKRMPYSGSG